MMLQSAAFDFCAAKYATTRAMHELENEGDLDVASDDVSLDILDEFSDAEGPGGADGPNVEAAPAPFHPFDIHQSTIFRLASLCFFLAVLQQQQGNITDIGSFLWPPPQQQGGSVAPAPTLNNGNGAAGFSALNFGAKNIFPEDILPAKDKGVKGCSSDEGSKDLPACIEIEG